MSINIHGHTNIKLKGYEKSEDIPLIFTNLLNGMIFNLLNLILYYLLTNLWN